eukprot:symbB.v1.2.038751.t1/scaffold6158.1/size20449/1
MFCDYAKDFVSGMQATASKCGDQDQVRVAEEEVKREGRLKLEVKEKEAKEKELSEERLRTEGQDAVSSMTPLFSEEQLKQMDEMYKRGPLLYRRETPVERPEWMKSEEERLQKKNEEEEQERVEMYRAAMLREHQHASMMARLYGLEKEQSDKMRGIESLEKENAQIRKANEELRKEQAALLKDMAELKEKVKIAEGSTYGTPEES